MRWYVRGGGHRHNHSAYSEHSTEREATQVAVDFLRDGYLDVEIGTLDERGLRTVIFDTDDIRRIATVSPA